MKIKGINRANRSPQAEPSRPAGEERAGAASMLEYISSREARCHIEAVSSVPKLALSRNKDASFWTIARVSALINGNHEILKADCRFGQVDPASTLTFADKCPLIDVMLTKHFDSSNKHPLLDLSYKEAVGERANLFISFAYADNFIDLVDALELYLETHSKEYPVDTTYFWFDTFAQ
jgi:hypothetical protein